jgi:hypothetical protein
MVLFNEDSSSQQTNDWPESWNDGHPLLQDDDTPIFLISVDGMHCTINEPCEFETKIDRFPKETIESPIFGRFYEQNCGKS